MIEFLWQTNEKSADYSFNKSHAACYALIGYRTAWLKANYPAEYMAALISSVMSTKDKVPYFVARCEEMGIEILPPDVNLSDHEFTVVERNIRFGLDAVKGVGYQAVEAIKRAREEGGAFTSLWDFCERVDNRTVNKKAIEALIKCGALGSTGASRKGMLDGARGGPGQRPADPAGRADRAGLDLRPAGRRPVGGARACAARSPAALRGARAPADPRRGVRAGASCWRRRRKRSGCSSPRIRSSRCATSLRARVDCPISALEDRRDKDWVTVGGIITEAKRIRTRNGDHMMFATLDDLAASVEMLVFGKALAEHEAALAVDEVVIVKGRVDHKEAGKTCLVVQSGASRSRPRRRRSSRPGRRRARPTARPPRWPGRCTCGLPRRICRASAIEDLKQAIEDFSGPAEVLVEIDSAAPAPARAPGRGLPRAAHAGGAAELEHALSRGRGAPRRRARSLAAAAGVAG